jgi:2,4-dienoyl-CoA reductase-like NADH-dependent reductase (Old Yellow Enzyme family)
MAVRYPRVASFKTAEAFAEHLTNAGIHLPFDPALAPAPHSPLGQPLKVDGWQLANRFAILPMEGWDGTDDGKASDLTKRRWQRFGQSGAALIWGGEAVAVRQDGRANPQQLLLTPANAASIGGLLTTLRDAHTERFGQTSADALVVGLQLTHSGRFARHRLDHSPDPLVAYEHPWLDKRFAGGVRVLTDEELDRLCDDFIAAARLAADLGFQFVDVKHCHGYLGHELLSARSRSGRYGGSLDNRLRFLRNVVDGVRAACPGLGIGVRLSVFDTVPHRRGPEGTGVAEVAPGANYPHAFGLLNDADIESTLADAREMLIRLRALNIRFVCITAGSPYYCPHVQRPALFPPSDGYDPPEDPLRGVARQIDAAARLKAAFSDMTFVGSGYSYLQEWLPHVAEPAVKNSHIDIVGVGRMVLSYPELPADVLAGRPLKRGSICRTFSDCTTAPRNRLVSGCYPLDPFFTKHPQHELLKAAKGQELPTNRERD